MSSILFVDANYLCYAWRAGGKELLDSFKSHAQGLGFEIALTDVVRSEVAAGPLKLELGKWLADQRFTVLQTDEGAKYRAFRQATPHGGEAAGHETKNAGERSIAQEAKRSKTAGDRVRIVSDDKWFSNK